MKIKCPYCDEKFSLEDFLKDSVMVQVIAKITEFGTHGRLAWEYAELFGISPPINVRKLYRVLAELRQFFAEGGFVFQKRKYEISREGLAAAMHTVCNAQVKRLQNHNYLKKVAITIAEEEAGKRSRDEESRRRKAESNFQPGNRVERITDVPGKIRTLLDQIGRPVPATDKKD